MSKLTFVVSLITHDNDFQMEQAAAAEEAARHLGVDIKVLYAGGDTIEQSQQLLQIIQSPREEHPSGIILEPAGGTGFPQVARASVSAGIPWVIVNREADYLEGLRRQARVPVFAVTSDHEEIGRIQSRQFAALLPKGGTVLYIQGPSESSAAKLRTAGMYGAKPANVDIKILRGNWTEVSAYNAVTSWLRLSTSVQSQMDLVAAQNDAMAIGAKKAFREIAEESLRERWLHLPFTGCDGVPKTGQTWVRSGQLTATVIVPPLTGPALEILIKALQTGSMPPERTTLVPSSYPAVENLKPARGEKFAASSGKK
jgi:ABC-type sugar transport system substrate-binding protein